MPDGAARAHVSKCRPSRFDDWKGKKAMSELLTKVLDAQGGLERWRSYNKVEATIVAGGGFFALKGALMDADPRRLTVSLHEERATLSNFGAADQRIMFTPGRIAVEKLDGT